MEESKEVLMERRVCDKVIRFLHCFFVLVMEYLTRLLLQASCSANFRFHPLCKCLGLVRLCFADDLIIFCKGDSKATKVLKEAFDEFSSCSGLIANQSKSHVYYGGVKESEKHSIAALVSFEEWAAFRLRRAQLIHSVLLGTRSYWMSIFILPQKVVKEIDKICRIFMWGGHGNTSKLQFASWEFDFWDYDVKADVSWYWRKLFHLKTSFTRDDILAADASGRFLIGKIYDKFLSHFAKSESCGVVWCRLAVPKHRFTLWQAINHHLLTRELLSTQRVVVDSLDCFVCGLGRDCHEHLFFDCLYSRKVIRQVQTWLGSEIWPLNHAVWLQ
ncbi:uncharacterized protein LOC133815473 [Humulus lupulus]|uniref:uncharacterized protein LOC133815473 n=1 Tax=Humulus lupulus TaxID=3486 RepID=UPI002B40EAB6|nr:uncharacterized protein LOC133815473 [Humulus lupulus]